jgi:hypothetical protein
MLTSPITPLSMSASADHGPPPLFPTPTPTDPPDGPVRDSTVFNYYFLFLVAFAVLLAVLFWWLRQQYKRRKELLRRRGHRALANDLERWAGTRGYMHGRYGQSQTVATTRREEGLDEHGQAPPPYEPKREVTAHTEAVPSVTIPLRTFARDEAHRAPPPKDDVATHALE